MKLYWLNQTEKLSAVMQRFPLPVLCGILFTLAVCLIVQNSQNGDPEINLLKIAMAASLGVPFLTALCLWAERNGGKLLLNMVLQSAGVLILLIYAVYFIPTEFVLFESKNTLIREAMLLFSSLMALFLAPYFNREKKTGFWEYVKLIIEKMLITVFFSMILFAGFSLAIFSANMLLDIGIKGDNIYGSLWAIIAGVFAVIFFLSEIPRNFEILGKINYDDCDNKEIKLIKVFAKFVLLPLILIYAVILYIYLTKILITQDWPNGWVALPILIFTIMGLMAQFLLYPLKNYFKWVKIFSTSFYAALIPVALMLILSIWKRIEEYAITEIRYLGVAAGLWLIGIALYNLLSKKKNLKVMILSLMIIAFLASFGRWGAFKVSETSQKNRLEQILIQNNILRNGKIVKAESVKVDPKAQREISNIIEYLMDNHGVKSLQNWFSQEIAKSDNEWKNWKEKNKLRENILAEMGINIDQSSENKFIGMRVEDNSQVYMVKNFDYAIPLNTPYGGNHTLSYHVDRAEKIIMQEEPNGQQLAVTIRNNRFVFDIRNLINNLRGKYDNLNDKILKMKEMTLTEENFQYKVSLYLSRINGFKIDENSYDVNFDGIVLIQIKK